MKSGSCGSCESRNSSGNRGKRLGRLLLTSLANHVSWAVLRDAPGKVASRRALRHDGCRTARSYLLKTPGRTTTRPSASVTSSSRSSMRPPVRSACRAMRSRASNASAAVGCSLMSVALPALVLSPRLHDAIERTSHVRSPNSLGGSALRLQDRAACSSRVAWLAPGSGEVSVLSVTLTAHALPLRTWVDLRAAPCSPVATRRLRWPRHEMRQRRYPAKSGRTLADLGPTIRAWITKRRFRTRALRLPKARPSPLLRQPRSRGGRSGWR